MLIRRSKVITGAGAVPPQSRTAAKGRAMPEYSFRKPGERGEIIGERWRGVEMEKDVGGKGGAAAELLSQYASSILVVV